MAVCRRAANWLFVIIAMVFLENPFPFPSSLSSFSFARLWKLYESHSTVFLSLSLLLSPSSSSSNRIFSVKSIPSIEHVTAHNYRIIYCRNNVISLWDSLSIRIQIVIANGIAYVQFVLVISSNDGLLFYFSFTCRISVAINKPIKIVISLPTYPNWCMPK